MPQYLYIQGYLLYFIEMMIFRVCLPFLCHRFVYYVTVIQVIFSDYNFINLFNPFFVCILSDLYHFILQSFTKRSNDYSQFNSYCVNGLIFSSFLFKQYQKMIFMRAYMSYLSLRWFFDLLTLFITAFFSAALSDLPLASHIIQ